MKLQGQVLRAEEVSETERLAMFRLMDEFYDGVSYDRFRRDFADKDFCLVLRSEDGVLRGFTTQKLLDVPVQGETVHGIFSGDTVIHRDYWGSTELFSVFARFYFDYALRFPSFYWFLICKGYKTYRILPAFWTEFYPRRGHPTPPREQAVIDAYASLLYPGDYNPRSGVIEYRAAKDRLKDGVAAVGDKERRHPDIAFFLDRNPGHAEGHDLACLARIDRRLLHPRLLKLLFGAGTS